MARGIPILALAVPTKARPRFLNAAGQRCRDCTDMENTMKALISVKVTVDIAKIITALSGAVLVFATIVNHL